MTEAIYTHNAYHIMYDSRQKMQAVSARMGFEIGKGTPHLSEMSFSILEPGTEIEEKMICPVCGTEFSKRTAKKYCSHACYSKTLIGKSPMGGKHHSLETRALLKELRRIQEINGKSPALGLHHSKETRERISQVQIGKKLSPDHKAKISIGVKSSEKYKSNYLKSRDPLRGVPRPKEVCEKISKAQIGKTISEETKAKLRQYTGERAAGWKGGISFEPYCPKFNREFKERVREFWGRKCFLCTKTEADQGKRLHVHHVNYDKMVCCNDIKPLFVPLCHSCHMKTTVGDRQGWEAYLTEQILLATDGECYLPKGV